MTDGRMGGGAVPETETCKAPFSVRATQVRLLFFFVYRVVSSIL